MKSNNYKRDVILAILMAVILVAAIAHAEQDIIPTITALPQKHSFSQSIREKIRADYQARLLNVENNASYRNNILETSRGIGGADSTRYLQPDENIRIALQTLIQIRGKIDSRITKEERLGYDMGAAVNLLSTADLKISDASEATAALTAGSSTDIGSATQKIIDLKDSLQIVVNAIIEETSATASTTVSSTSTQTE